MRLIGKLMVPAAALLLTAAALSTAGTRTNADQEWPVYGQNAAQHRFAALDQINTGNVSRLGLAWYHEFDTDRGQEATPIMVDGKIYVSTAWSKVYAFDARTGKLLWGYDPQVPPQTLPKGCCDAVNRGVSVADGRVFVSTLDGRLIALDQQSGKVLWSTMTVDQSKSYTSSGATYVAKNLVLIGNSGAEYGVRGYVSAYDVATGKLVWRFYTVPSPDRKPDGQVSDKPLRDLAEPTWFGDALRDVGGGGTVWDSMTYDPETGLLYIGVGNGGPYVRAIRSEGKGDNLFVSSIVAVKAATGEYVWHYQTTPGDEWDFTATQHIMLVDGVIDGKPRKLLMQAPKNGFFYVLDRLTGKLLSAEAYSKVTWATGVDMKIGRPIEVPAARYDVKGGFVQYPSGLGAHSWHPMAYSPKTGLVYIPVQVMPMEYKTDPNFKYRPGHMNIGLDSRTLSMPDDPKALADIKSAIYGELVAWDPKAQKQRWSVTHQYLLNGGVLATAGGLVFQGTGDGKLAAYDAGSGKELWSYRTVNGIIAPPISYSIDGKQYVAVMVGYGGAAAMYGTFVADGPRLPGRLMVFALDGKAKAADYAIPAPDPVDLTGVSSKGDVAAGLAAYNDSCMTCHGFSTRSSFTRDLRRSEMIKDPENFKAIVIDGVFAEKGMRGFAPYLAPKDAENIRAYIISEARRIAPNDKGTK